MLTRGVCRSWAPVRTRREARGTFPGNGARRACPQRRRATLQASKVEPEALHVWPRIQTKNTPTLAAPGPVRRQADSPETTPRTRAAAWRWPRQRSMLKCEHSAGRPPQPETARI